MVETADRFLPFSRPSRIDMESIPPDQLLQALRECGLFTPEQLLPLDALSPELCADLPALSERLRSDGLLTNYQTRKLRINRMSELFVGQYLVMDKIGEGGMGKVYKAVQLRMGRFVALKVVRPHLLSNRTVMRRYKRETAAAAKLNHPNIVTLIDADEFQGRHFMAMEFVNGSDLSRLVKEFGPLPYQEAAEYIRQVSFGLQHAHDCGFVHRDIKPSNMLVSGNRAIPGTGGIATVKLLDMGLVRSLDDDDDDVSKTELTRDGTVVGTPDYMSPEQAKNSSTVDHRADLYSLGCTLFYLLVGKPPFPDGTPIEKLLRHQIESPPDLRFLNPDLPLALVEIIEKLLSKKTAGRISSGRELAELLHRFTPDAEAAAATLSDRVARTRLDTPPNSSPPSERMRARVPDGATIVTVSVSVASDQKTSASPTPSVPLMPTPEPRRTPTRKPVPVALPKAPSAKSSTSLGVSDLPDSDEIRTKRIPRKTVAKKKAPASKPFPMILAIAGGVGVLAVVGTIFALMASGERPDPETTPTNPAPRTVVQPTRRATHLGLTPIQELLPEQASTLAIWYPTSNFTTAREHFTPKQLAAINTLANRFRFDLRVADRVTVATISEPSFGWLGILEGEFITPEWTQFLSTHPGVTLRTDNDTPYYQFTPAKDTTTVHYAVVLDSQVYALSDRLHLLLALARRTPTASKAKWNPAFADAFPDPNDPDPPTLTLASAGNIRLPRDRVDFSGVEGLCLKGRLKGQELVLTGTLFAGSREAIDRFTNLSVYDFVKSDQPLLKPFVMPLFRDDSSYIFNANGPTTKLTFSASWPLAAAHQWLDPFLPELSR